MKRVFISAALAASLSLGACSATGRVAEISGTLYDKCQRLKTALTIATLVSASASPTVAVVINKASSALNTYCRGDAPVSDADAIARIGAVIVELTSKVDIANAR